jgi:hypothetical protein
VERLEQRWMPTITNPYHNPDLPRVEVQAVYYGDYWAGTGGSADRSYLEGFLSSIVQGSYMDMLSQAGYGVGCGSYDPGIVNGSTGFQYINPALGEYGEVSDGQLQGALQSDISAGKVISPGANHPDIVYVVFTAPDVTVIGPEGGDSSRFAGYHNYFVGQDSSQGLAFIRYLVLPYPGGPVGNLRVAVPQMSALDSITASASHELAEEVTNPNVPLNGTLSAAQVALCSAWTDNGDGAWVPTSDWTPATHLPATGGVRASVNEEIGDITQGRFVYLPAPDGVHQYAVQRIADQHDQPMTPAGAVPRVREVFVLDASGNLYESTPGTGSPGAYPTYALSASLASNVASISDQGIDNYGEAVVDFVTTDGHAYEYHDYTGAVVPLGANVASARAGQGASYLLTTSGGLYEHRDQPADSPVADAGLSQAVGYLTYLKGGVTAIDAGTDRYGVNMVDLVTYNPIWDWTLGSERSDTGTSYGFGIDVTSVSAGQQGVSAFIRNGSAYAYNETSGTATLLRIGAAAVAAGTDGSGNPLFAVLDGSHNLYAYTPSGGAGLVAGNVLSISKPRLGHLSYVSVLPTNGKHLAFDFIGYGWLHLGDNNALQVG